MPSYAELAREVLAARERLGGTRLVCVDGPAGSGKTTFAERLADALTPLGGRPALVHMDDLYAGWTLTGAAARLAAGVLRPVAGGRPGAVRRWDWHAGGFAAEPTVVPVTAVLLVEGCGSSPRRLDPWTTLRIWVEAPPELCARRWRERGGAEMAHHQADWARREAAVFAAERTRDRAQLHVDGAADAGPGGYALARAAPDTPGSHARDAQVPPWGP